MDCVRVVDGASVCSGRVCGQEVRVLWSLGSAVAWPAWLGMGKPCFLLDKYQDFFVCLFLAIRICSSRRETDTISEDLGMSKQKSVLNLYFRTGCVSFTR